MPDHTDEARPVSYARNGHETSLDVVFGALARSKFRSQFALTGRDLQYLRTQGLTRVLSHAADFIEQRLAPAQPVKDGKQTPWRGHPVFVAQHATATCCRGCLQKWHAIPTGSELTREQKRYVRAVIRRWLAAYCPDG